MDTTDHDLPAHELLALKEVRLTGRLTNRALVARLFTVGAIGHCDDGGFELTARGKNLLVRGSPALWSFAPSSRRRADLPN